MASRIDLSRNQVVVEDGRSAVTVTTAELLLARDGSDVVNTITAKLGRETLGTYYFHEDLAFGGWECISGPRGMRPPKPSEWPSAQRTNRT